MAKRGEKAVSLGEKLRKQQYDAIWKEYCGFLDLTMQDYMKIQNRLMEEQIQLWSDCELGKSILKGRRPSGIDEFRRLVPLTTYEDYADMLLQKRSETLPGNPRAPSDKSSTIHEKYAGYLQEQCSCLPHIGYKPRKGQI